MKAHSLNIVYSETTQRSISFKTKRLRKLLKKIFKKNNPIHGEIKLDGKKNEAFRNVKSFEAAQRIINRRCNVVAAYWKDSFYKGHSNFKLS